MERIAQDAGRERGFSLIELMIVVAIIAIIAAVAVPSYQDSIWKGKRGEAKAAILKALQAEERYYTQSNTYVPYSTTAPSSAFPIFSADNAANSRYLITAKSATIVGSNGTTLCAAPTSITQCVVITATVIGDPDPKCGATLQMDSIGNKLADAPKPADIMAVCWK